MKGYQEVSIEKPTNQSTITVLTIKVGKLKYLFMDILLLVLAPPAAIVPKLVVYNP